MHFIRNFYIIFATETKTTNNKNFTTMKENNVETKIVNEDLIGSNNTTNLQTENTVVEEKIDSMDDLLGGNGDTVIEEPKKKSNLGVKLAVAGGVGVVGAGVAAAGVGAYAYGGDIIDDIFDDKDGGKSVANNVVEHSDESKVSDSEVNDIITGGTEELGYVEQPLVNEGTEDTTTEDVNLVNDETNVDEAGDGVDNGYMDSLKGDVSLMESGEDELNNVPQNQTVEDEVDVVVTNDEDAVTVVPKDEEIEDENEDEVDVVATTDEDAVNVVSTENEVDVVTTTDEDAVNVVSTEDEVLDYTSGEEVIMSEVNVNVSVTPAASVDSDLLADSDIAVSHSNNDHLSFDEAFAAARAEVGGNGVFKWHGGYYGTYHAEEWDALSDEFKNYFNNRNWAAEFVNNEEVELAENSDLIEDFEQINAVLVAEDPQQFEMSFILEGGNVELPDIVEYVNEQLSGEILAGDFEIDVEVESVTPIYANELLDESIYASDVNKMDDDLLADDHFGLNSMDDDLIC